MTKDELEQRLQEIQLALVRIETLLRVNTPKHKIEIKQRDPDCTCSPYDPLSRVHCRVHGKKRWDYERP